MQQLSNTTKSRGRPPSIACAESLLETLPSVMWFVRRNMRRLSKTGLSVAQYRTLLVLNALSNPTLGQVAENLGATLPTTSRVVSGLVRKGYVVRKDVSEDRRCISLQLTAAGKTVFRSARKETQKLVAAEIEELSAVERIQLIETMQRLGGIFCPDKKVGKDHAANLKRV